MNRFEVKSWQRTHERRFARFALARGGGFFLVMFAVDALITRHESWALRDVVARIAIFSATGLLAASTTWWIGENRFNRGLDKENSK
jgi:hypothetical protein